jgi:hypothetical protein
MFNGHYQQAGTNGLGWINGSCLSLCLSLSVSHTYTPADLTPIQSKGSSHVIERSDVVDSRGDGYPRGSMRTVEGDPLDQRLKNYKKRAPRDWVPLSMDDMEDKIGGRGIASQRIASRRIRRRARE